MGRSEAVTVERLRHAEAIVQFMDSLGVEKATLVGNSMKLHGRRGGLPGVTAQT